MVKLSMNALPEDIYLPGGWGCRRAEDGSLAFARDGDRIVVEAERTTDGPHPHFDCPYAWSLTYQQRTEIAVVGGSIGFVTTKKAAIDGLLAGMRQINTTLGADPDVDLRPLLEEVDLYDEIPAANTNEQHPIQSDPTEPSISSEDGHGELQRTQTD